MGLNMSEHVPEFPPVNQMTTDEKLDEILLHLRALTQILQGIGQNPMVAQMAKLYGVNL